MSTPATPPATPRASSSTLLIFLTFGIVLVLIFDRSLAVALGNAVGFVLAPIIGFHQTAPLWTIFAAGILMVVTTTIIRHFFTDWVKMARNQEIMRSFQKEFSQARKDNNTYKIKRLTEQQPELMQVQTEMSGEQMKPMAFTMLVVIPIFAWLSSFLVAFPLYTTCGVTVAVPWQHDWNLGPTACHGNVSVSPITFIPHWVALYSLFSFPVGTITQRALKLWEFRHVDLDADGVPAGKEV